MAINRRVFLLGTGAALLAPPTFGTTKHSILKRTIPSSGEAIPAIGMGTWLTFDINPAGTALQTRIDILKTFFEGGGSLIDSSPMYGQSEEVLGHCLKALQFPANTFSASKVWTSGQQAGQQQMEESRRLWQLQKFTLMQIHNLLDWKAHMASLLDWKEKGRIKYLGITTYGGLKHEMFANIMKNYPIDFIQLTYNILDREAEQKLLPLAADKGIAVIANRPLQGGQLFNYVSNKKFPAWALDLGCENWAQFFLKYIVSNPAITCAIPATSKVNHMKKNIASLRGELPNGKARSKMYDFITS